MSEDVGIDDQIKELHSELRNVKPGKWAVFFGAGSSYDFGIPTMARMARFLSDVIAGKQKCDKFSPESLEYLKKLVRGNGESHTWDIENLLTQIYQLESAFKTTDDAFVSADVAIDGDTLQLDRLEVLSRELIDFVSWSCSLLRDGRPGESGKSLEYLSNFLYSATGFGDTVKIFTTNIDSCVEAAFQRLSFIYPDLFELNDGFSSQLLPVFDIQSFDKRTVGRRHVNLWKLHGSVDWSAVHQKSTPQISTKSVIVRSTSTELNTVLTSAGLDPEKDIEYRSVIYPTPEKYLQTYSFPYIELFSQFRNQLSAVNVLIVVGTSFPDQHIRSAVVEFAARPDTHMFVIDPGMQDETLVKMFSAAKTVHPVIHIGFADFVEKFGQLG